MSETPIGDEVQSEVMGAVEADEQDVVTMDSPYAIPGEEPDGWVPNDGVPDDAAQPVSDEDPEPVLNDDAGDDLADVEEGEDTGDDTGDDLEDEAEPAAEPAE